MARWRPIPTLMLSVLTGCQLFLEIDGPPTPSSSGQDGAIDSSGRDGGEARCPPPGDGGSCPQGISWNGRCYIVVSGGDVTRERARELCQGLGGNVLTITCSEELRIVPRLAADIWLAARANGRGGWVYETGETFPDLPVPPTSGDDLCLVLSAGALKPIECDRDKEVICEIGPPAP